MSYVINAVGWRAGCDSLGASWYGSSLAVWTAFLHKCILLKFSWLQTQAPYSEKNRLYWKATVKVARIEGEAGAGQLQDRKMTSEGIVVFMGHLLHVRSWAQHIIWFKFCINPMICHLPMSCLWDRLRRTGVQLWRSYSEHCGWLGSRGSGSTVQVPTLCVGTILGKREQHLGRVSSYPKTLSSTSVFTFLNNDSQSVGPEPVALASPENLIEIQMHLPALSQNYLLWTSEFGVRIQSLNA
jgi:hypothetical protein